MGPLPWATSASPKPGKIADCSGGSCIPDGCYVLAVRGTIQCSADRRGVETPGGKNPIGRPIPSEAPCSSVLARVCLTSDRSDSGVQHQGAQPIRVLSVAARCALTMLDGSVVLPSAEGQCHRPGAGYPRQHRSPGKWARPRARHRMQPCTGKTRTPQRSLLQDGAAVLASFPPRSGNADHPERRRVVACRLVVPVGGRSSAPLRSSRRVGGSVVRRWALWRHSLLRLPERRRSDRFMTQLRLTSSRPIGWRRSVVCPAWG